MGVETPQNVHVLLDPAWCPRNDVNLTKYQDGTGTVSAKVTGGQVTGAQVTGAQATGAQADWQGGGPRSRCPSNILIPLPMAVACIRAMGPSWWGFKALASSSSILARGIEEGLCDVRSPSRGQGRGDQNLDRPWGGEDTASQLIGFHDFEWVLPC